MKLHKDGPARPKREPLPTVDLNFERTLDNTALSTYQQCPEKYRLSMVLHRRSGRDSAALIFGNCMHTLLEFWYRTGDRELARAVAAKKWGERMDALGFSDYRTFGRALLVFDQYIEKWGHPSTTDDITLGLPDSPMVELSTNVVLPMAAEPYAVRIDRIFEMDGGIYIEDHKTTSQFGPKFYDEFWASGQMMGYARVANLLIDRPIRGVRINVLAVRKNDTEFDRKIIEFTPSLLKRWEENFKIWHGRIEESKRTGVYGRNWSACAHKYGMCPYVEYCTTDEQYQQSLLEQDFEVAPWDPSAQHDD